MGHKFFQDEIITNKDSRNKKSKQQANQNLEHFKYISYAINLSKRNLGNTAENPVVGCVIVKNGEIISSGVTSKNGRPHAEIIAIEKVVNKKKLIGATMYVTLEPCCHYGKSPPCVESIIKHKIAKVIVGTIDPDLRVNNQGIEKLIKAGIQVESGFLVNECREINRGFFKSRETKTPFISLKIATSLDGKIATKSFDSKWITNEEARRFSHFLRAKNDAILVGANTIKKDNPRLNCRIEGLEDFSPKKIIISYNLDFNFDELVFQNQEDSETIIVTSIKNYSSQKLKNWQKNNKFNKVVWCEQETNSKEQLNLIEVLQNICALGINSILVEGGSKIITQFLQQNLVDELIWIRSRKIIGNDGIPAINDLSLDRISDALENFKTQNFIKFSDNLVEIFQK